MLESSAGGFDSPLDLVHLARQCLGDQELEAELLGLFRLQARALTAQLSELACLSSESKAKIAHTLRGSALAVGAGASPAPHGASRNWPRPPATSARRRRRDRRAQSAVAEALTEIDRLRG